MSRPYDADPYHRGSALSRSFLPLALITLGVVVLLSNFTSGFISDRGRGGLVVFGLGAAFAVGRLTTGRYGYAVPAGLLMGIGAHVVASSLELARGTSSAGLFFVFLGLGFVLAYLIGVRAASVWPLFPAAILVGLGLVLLGVASLGPLAAWSWIATYWPATLVLLGAWLLFRDWLPPGVRAPIATLGGMALLIYGVVAATSSIAAAGSFARPGVSPFANSMTLEQPLAEGQTLTVTNASGSTTIRATNSSTVHVVATRHFAPGGPPVDVQLTPDGSGLNLAAAAARRFPFGDAGAVDYAIDVPASAAVHAQATSGSIDLSNIGGEVRVTTTSGSIKGSQLQHLRQAQSTSGSISLDGVFVDQAQVNASSGTVNIRLLPGSAVVLDVHTGSGSIEPHGLTGLTGAALTRRDTLTGTIGTPAPDATLHVQTSSGNIIVRE